MAPAETGGTAERFGEFGKSAELIERELAILIRGWKMRAKTFDFQMFERLQQGQRAGKLFRHKSPTAHPGINREMHLEATSLISGNAVEIPSLIQR
jgi:hypothetical protein